MNIGRSRYAAWGVDYVKIDSCSGAAAHGSFSKLPFCSSEACLGKQSIVFPIRV